MVVAHLEYCSNLTFRRVRRGRTWGSDYVNVRESNYECMLFGGQGMRDTVSCTRGLCPEHPRRETGKRPLI